MGVFLGWATAFWIYWYDGAVIALCTLAVVRRGGVEGERVRVGLEYGVVGE